jgi:hypothetical protein
MERSEIRGRYIQVWFSRIALRSIRATRAHLRKRFAFFAGHDGDSYFPAFFRA